MSFQPIKGVIVPTLTPFDDTGAVDTTKIAPLTEFLISHGVKGLFPSGTTGEGVLLTIEERKQLAEATVKAANGSVPVIVHTGANTTRETIELTKHARDIGAYAVAIVTPYYFKHTDEALEQHYITVIEAVPDIPIYLYNIPQFTGNSLPLNLVMKLAASYDNVVGLKDSSGDLQVMFAVKKLHDAQFNTAIGPDDLIVAGLSMGLDACVSGHANVVPEIVVGIYDATVCGDLEQAQNLQFLLNQVSAAMDHPRRMSIWKGVLAHRGVSLGGMRAPLLTATDEDVQIAVNKLIALDVLPSA